MTEAQSHKSSHQDHSNCENCLRQHHQNQTWINIYRRLQQVQKNTNRISNAVQQHKLSNDTNRSFFNSYHQNIISLPKVKKQCNSSVIESAGFEVAIDLLQRQSRSKLLEQNGRLKKILSQMRKQRWEGDCQNTSNNHSSYFTDRTVSKHLAETNISLTSETNISLSSESNFSLSSVNTSLVNTQFREADQLQPQKRHSQEAKETSTTQSSSFNTTPKTFDLSRYNDLSLWLYQNDRHSKLEEDLFAPRPKFKHSIGGKRVSQILPAINPKK